MRAVVLSSLLLLATLPVAAQTPEEAFHRGNAAYTAGRFEEAIEAYETALRYRIRDPRLEFNIGNALFKRGRLGQAILHYERARRLDPTDEDIKSNLEFARTFTRDQVTPEEQAGIVAFVVRLQDRLGPDVQAWFALGMIWAAAALVAWGLSEPGRWNGTLGWSLAVLLLLFAVSAASWRTSFERLEGRQMAIVLDEAVEVLAGPGFNNATLFTVHEGLTVEVRGEIGEEWVQVSLPNGLNGWMPLDAVGLV